jgi:hypothetical protein
VKGDLMKVRVQHRKGRIETLTLTGSVSVLYGERLNRLVDENGFEHFFTPDGYYDGWGVRPAKLKT